MKKKQTKIIPIDFMYQIKHKMECGNCGKEIDADTGYFCNNCGTQNDYIIKTPEGYVI